MTSDPYAEALLDACEERIRRARTATPGLVSTVDGDADRELAVTFEVGPGTRQGDTEVSDGSIPGAPVVFLGGGGYSLRWPLVAGDEALAIACDRPIDRWRSTRTPGQASTWASQDQRTRHHSLSDALILPLTITASDGSPETIGEDLTISGPAGTAITIRPDGSISIVKPAVNLDGEAKIELLADGSIVATPAPGKRVDAGGAEDLARATQLVAAVDAMLAALVAAGAGPAFAGASGAQSAWNALKNTIATIVTRGG